jgi:hypothetical protein
MQPSQLGEKRCTSLLYSNIDTKQEAALAYDREARPCGEDKPLNYESIEAAEEAAAHGAAGAREQQ